MRRMLCLLAALLSGCAPLRMECFRPEVIRFGASLGEIETSLDGMCTELEIREIDPPFLARVRNRQMQIDCDGFNFRGRGRHAEFVFRDDVLVMVWLMVEPGEADATIAAMTRAYGNPSRRNQSYVAFEQASAAWRHHPAEILFYGGEVADDIAANFD